MSIFLVVTGNPPIRSNPLTPAGLSLVASVHGSKNTSGSTICHFWNIQFDRGVLTNSATISVSTLDSSRCPPMTFSQLQAHMEGCEGLETLHCYQCGRLHQYQFLKTFLLLCCVWNTTNIFHKHFISLNSVSEIIHIYKWILNLQRFVSALFSTL